MPTIDIEGPDGRVVSLDAPDGATPDQIKSKVEQVKANWSQIAAQEGPRENETSATGAALRGAGQGFFGLGDEATAAAKAAYGKVTGQGDFGPQYDAALAEERRLLEQGRKEHPIASYGAEIGTTLAVPFGAAKMGIKGAQLAGKTLPQQIKALGAESALYGGGYGAGASEGGLQERLEGAAGGAMLGGVVGGALPVVGKAISPLTRRIADDADTLLNPQAAGVRSVAKEFQSAQNAVKPQTATQGHLDVLENEARMLADQGRPIPQRAVIDAGQETRDLARTAANMSPQARGELGSFVQDRFLGQTGNARTFVQDLAGGPIDNAAERIAAKQAASSANNPLYRVAYDEGDKAMHSDVIDRIIGGSGEVRKAIQKAVPAQQERMVAEGYGGLNSKVSVTPDGQIQFSRGGVGGPRAYPNLHFWDTVKRNLDARINELSRSGDDGAAGTLRTIKNNLRDELDRLVPSYKTARETSFGFFQAKDAREAGENFIKNGARFSTNEAKQAVSKMTDAQKGEFRRGYLGKLMEEIERNPDRRDIANAFFRSADDRARAELALGSRKARELEAYFHVEGVMQAAKNAVQGNSTTARQLADLTLAGGAAGGSYAYGADPTTAIMIAGVLSAGRMGSRQMMQGMRDKKALEMARLLMGSPQELNAAIQKIASSPRLLDRLRNASGSMAASTRSIPGMASGEYMAQGEQR